MECQPSNFEQMVWLEPLMATILSQKFGDENYHMLIKTLYQNFNPNKKLLNANPIRCNNGLDHNM